MKKKFFTTLVLFATLALAACGAKPADKSSADSVAPQSAEQPTTSEKAPASSSNHRHKYGDWTVVKEATCEEAGEQERVCECGEKQTKVITALGHDWDEGEITTPATCSTPGVKTFHCKRAGCTATKTEAVKADHVWGEATPVAGAEGEVDYNIFSCTVCSTKKIEFAAKQAAGKSVIDGSLKSDSTFPDYLKLSSNGNSVTFKINSTIAGNAKIYQRGVMDYWHDGNNENQARNYYAGKSSTDGNFRLDVNGTAVDYSWSKDVTYEDMLPGEAQGTYSPLGDALIGDCAIIEGVNTIKYTRTESYNMLIKDFVIIFEPAA